MANPSTPDNSLASNGPPSVDVSGSPGTRTESDDRTPADPDDLERLGYGTLLPSFTGTTVPRWITNALGHGLAGVTLFGPNITSDSQLRRLTAELRQGGDHPLVCLDEEGGDVTRIGYSAGSRYPGNAALGAVDDPELTTAVYRAMGADLVRLGINLDLAPCADVNSEAENPVIGTRAFGSEPEHVARHTTAAVNGLQDAGVAACVKHFPGHGATRQDSHHEIPTVTADQATLHARELVPFRAAVDAGCRTLMSAHVRVTGLTGELPATLSRATLHDLVRNDLRFDGVVITDALDMKAITESVGLAEGAVRSLDAGSDLLCLGPAPGADEVADIVAAVVSAVQQGRLSRSRLEESAARVARLRQWLAGLPAGDPAGRPAAPGPSTDVGLVAARRAIRSSEPSFTLTGRAVRVVEVQSPPTIAVGEVPWGLSTVLNNPANPETGDSVGPLDDAVTDIVRLDPTSSITDAELTTVLQDARGVVVVRDAHRHPAAQELVERLLRLRSDTVLVEMGLPIWQPPVEPATYLATYGAARVNARAAAEYLGLSDR